MPAKVHFPSFIFKPLSDLRSSFKSAQKPLWALVLIVVVALGAWANTAWTAASSPTTATALTPALRLAIGTVNLEGTQLAVDSTAAATLLPLWELLEQLDTSGSAAPQEITAVVNEIQLDMSSEQIKAIDAMSIDQSQLGAPGSAASSVAISTGTSAQASAAANDPALGGDMTGGAPMDGGGPMQSGQSQSTSSASKTSSAAASPAAIQEVIRLLKSKVQG